MDQKIILYFILLGICLCVQSADRGKPKDWGDLNRARLASLRASQESLTKKPHPVQTVAGPRVIDDYFGAHRIESPSASCTDALAQSLASSASTQPIAITARVSRQSPSNTSPLAIEVLKRSVHAKSAGDAGMVFQPQDESDTMGRSAPSGVVSALVHAVVGSTESGVKSVLDDDEDEKVDAFFAHAPLQARDGLVTTEGLESSGQDEAMYHSARADDVLAASAPCDGVTVESVEDADRFWPEDEVPEKTWTARDGTRCAFFKYKDPTYGQLLDDCFGPQIPKQKSKPRKLKQD